MPWFYRQTYNANKQVPDSASTATALFSGVKTNSEVVGVDSNVNLGDCASSLNTSYHVASIIEWAQQAGKATGVLHIEDDHFVISYIQVFLVECLHMIFLKFL